MNPAVAVPVGAGPHQLFDLHQFQPVGSSRIHRMHDGCLHLSEGQALEWAMQLGEFIVDDALLWTALSMLALLLFGVIMLIVAFTRSD